MRIKHDIRFKLMATGLRLAGHKKVADIILSSWKVWKLYNTSTMDFHLFFCCHNAAELQVRAFRAPIPCECPSPVLLQQSACMRALKPPLGSLSSALSSACNS